MYWSGVITLAAVNLVAVLGVSWLTGFTGLFSFGHAAFMAVGAYTAGTLTAHYGWPFIPALLVGMLAAGLVSLILGIPTIRLKGDYFTIAALGFGEAVRVLLEYAAPLTGGAQGLMGIPTYTTLSNTLGALVLGIVAFALLLRTRFGKSCVAVREDELAAESLGINVTRTKLLALAVSAAYCGLSGGLFAHAMSFIQPANFGLAKSTELAATVVLGGIGTLSGSLVSGIFLALIPELFRAFADYRMVFYGLALTLTMVLRPQGILGYRELRLPHGLKSRRSHADEEAVS
jgi:branched-chain amino acid transport system permease protein